MTDIATVRVALYDTTVRWSFGPQTPEPMFDEMEPHRVSNVAETTVTVGPNPAEPITLLATRQGSIWLAWFPDGHLFGWERLDHVANAGDTIDVNARVEFQ